MEHLLRLGRTLQEVNSKQHTVLLQAACGGHMELVAWLLEEAQGFDLGQSDLDGNTSLLFAAWGGHFALMEYLLLNGSSLDESNANGHSVFLSAANGGRVEIVEWLLAKGFNLTDTNTTGDTALLLASYGGHVTLVERLLELGASLADRNACGFTPLLSAANGGQLAMAKWLLEHGATLDEVDNDGYDCVILAACGGNEALVSFFLEQGASLASRNSNGDSAVLLAAYCGHADLVGWLLRNGSQLSEKNNTGMGVLISAANGGSVEVVQLVLQHIAMAGPDGDQIEGTDEGGYTAFLLAAQRGHLGVLQTLLAYGANARATTARTGANAVELAADFADVQQYLRLAHDWTALEAAVDARMVDRVHVLVQLGAANVPGVAAKALKLASATQGYPTAKPPVPELVTMLRRATMPFSPRRAGLFSHPHLRAILDIKRVQHHLARSSALPYLPDEVWRHTATLIPRCSFHGPDDLVGHVEPSSSRSRLRWRQRQLQHVEPESDDEDIVVDNDDHLLPAGEADVDAAAAGAAVEEGEDDAEGARARNSASEHGTALDDDADAAVDKRAARSGIFTFARRAGWL